MGLLFWESSFNDAMETDVEETDLFSIYRVVIKKISSSFNFPFNFLL